MKWLKQGGIIVAVIAVAIGLKLYNKGSDEADIKKNMHEWVANAPGYASDPAYCDQLFERCHPAAFESSYSIGGRRTPARFDDTKYIAELSRTMSSAADADGKAEIAAGLRVMKAVYDAAPSR